MVGSAQISRATSYVRLPPLPSIKDLIRLYKLRALRQLSQNFLLDERITNKLVNQAGSIKGAEVCEVGPGPGCITRSIIRKGAEKVILIEKDLRFMPTLKLLAEAAPCEIKILHGDVMSFNMENLFSEENRRNWLEEPPNIHIIGNLPFNVSTPLIIRWLKDISYRQNAWNYGRVRLTLTFQKEFAERCVAKVESPERCRLSVMCQNWCSVSYGLTIPGAAFLPRPKVDVSVVRFTPLKYPLIPLPFELIEKVVRTVFAGKKKYCINGIGNLFPQPVREKLGEEVINLAEIKPECRPVDLTVPEIGRICYAYKEICDRNPKLYKYNHRQAKGKDADFLEDPDSEADSSSIEEEFDTLVDDKETEEGIEKN